MNLYVWNYLNEMSSNYHSEGGVVVIAETVEQARELFLKDYSPNSDNKTGQSDIITTEPTLVCGVDATEPHVFEFPNAGCC